MKRKPARYLVVLLGICALFAVSTPARPSNAAAIDVGLYTIRFIEISAAKPNAGRPASLMFYVHPSGKMLLLVLRTVPDPNGQWINDSDLIWQQEGQLTPEELGRVTQAQLALLNMPDQNWPDRNFAIDLRARVINTNGKVTENKRLLLNPDLKSGSEAQQVQLKNALQTIQDVRKRFEPLVVFNWSGGFAGRETQLTIRPQGQMIFEDQRRRKSVTDKITPPDLELVQQLIHSPAYLTYSPPGKQTCADCWEYSLVTLSQNGLKVTEFEQTALEAAPQPLKTLVTLLSDLSDQEAMVRVSLTPEPSLTASPFSTKFIPTPTRTAMPTNTLPPGRTATPTRVPEQWQSTLTSDDAHINLDVLDSSNDVFIGAVKGFQLRPGEVPKECVVFVIRGPMALATGLFGPGWMEVRHNWTDAMIASRIQDGIEALSQFCPREKIQVFRYP